MDGINMHKALSRVNLKLLTILSEFAPSLPMFPIPKKWHLKSYWIKAALKNLKHIIDVTLNHLYVVIFTYP